MIRKQLRKFVRPTLSDAKTLPLGDTTRPRRTLSGKLLPAGTPRPLTWEHLVEAGPAPKKSARVEEQDVQRPVFAREQRRFTKRAKARQQRKGQRIYVRTTLAQRFREQTMEARVAVLEAGPDAPGNYHRFYNVLHALEKRYGTDEVAKAVQAL